VGTPIGPAYDLRLERLLADLADARAELLAAVDALSPAQEAEPRLLDEWSLGQMLAHLGYWAGWATQAIYLTEQGQLAAHDDPALDRNDRNATMARIAAQTDLPTVRAREAAAAAALAERLRGLDPELLDTIWSDGTSTLEKLIGDNAGSHYRKHVADIEAAASGVGA
jgi:hypothetical protein